MSKRQSSQERSFVEAATDVLHRRERQGRTSIRAVVRRAASACRRLGRDRSGASAVEFALVSPLFLLLVCGIVVYGVWFSLAQSVQSLATESARAAIAGLDETERQSLAQAYVNSHAPELGLTASNLTGVVDVTGSSIRVTVRFNMADHPVMALKGLIPTPPAVIERSAVVGNS